MKTPNNQIPQWLAGAILTLVLAILALAPRDARAQATPNPPGQISYQGFLTDANGVPLATNAPRNYNVFFHIYNSPSASGALWGELQTVTVDRGYFSVLLGQGASAGDGSPWTNNLTGLFAASDASDRYVGITLQGFSEVQPRLRLLSSPYSLLAANAIGLVGNTGIQVLNAFGTNVAINESPSGIDSLDIKGNVGLFGSGTLDFGQGIGGQTPNAGKIGYEALSLNALDITGAGTSAANQKIKLWANGGVSTTGPLGVGTDTPLSMLHVKSVSSDAEISVESGDAGSHRWTMQSSSGQGSFPGVYQIVDRTAGVSRLAIDTHGNVGLGTTTPGATLEVSGSTYLDGYNGISGSQVLEFGRGVAGKEGNAGKIGYGTFSSGASLDIVGAGPASTGLRSIELYAEAGTTTTGPLSTAGNISAPSLALGGASITDGLLSLNGNARMNNNNIYFRSGTDRNHYIGYVYQMYDSYFSQFPTIDGPGIFGCGGGGLGTACVYGAGAPYLTAWWDTQNFYVENVVKAQGYQSISDRNVKTNFEAIDEQNILTKVSTLPISSWNFTNTPSERHTGPMAQDFFASFGGTSDDKHISLGDEAGVALAAIKGLNEIVQQKDNELQTLKQQVQELQAAVANLTKGRTLNSQ